MRERKVIIIPMLPLLIAFTIFFAVAVAGLTTMDHPSTATGAEQAQPEMTHGHRLMPSVLQARAQRFYDAVADGDADTVWSMTHPGDQNGCTPEGLLTAATTTDPHGRPMEATAPSNAQWNVNHAQIWHGHTVGVTSAHPDSMKQTGPDEVQWQMVWTRHDSPTWQALPGCAAASN